MHQLQGVSDVESAEFQPMDLNTAVVKELCARWLVKMAEHIYRRQSAIHVYRKWLPMSWHSKCS